MQCYTPVFFHARDPNIGVFNEDASYGEERGYNISVPQCPMDRYLGYDKEVLRRTIQNHEATFRYQVQELHQLHKRQRELMHEIRFMQHLYLQTSNSNHSLFQGRSNISQEPAENIQEPPTFVFRSKGHETRILDLELLADVHHDDERGKFKDGNFSEAPEATCHSPEKLLDIQPSSYSELVSLEKGDLSGFRISSRKTNLLIDLNEPAPVQLDSLSSSPTLDIYAHVVEVNDPHFPQEAKPESVVAKHCELVNCDRSTDAMNSSSVAIDLNSMPLSCLSETAITLEKLQNINNEKPPGCSVEILALKNLSENRDDENAEKAIALDCSSAHDHAMRKNKSVKEIFVVDTGIDDKFLEVKTYIDLNVAIKSAGEIDLEAPVSPENKEASPPRRKSEDIHLETSHPLSEQEEREATMELDRIAAKTLIMIFSSEVQEHFRPTNTKSFSNCLSWFAGIVSSTGDDPKVIKLQSRATGDVNCKPSEENAVNLSYVLKEEKETGCFSSSSGRRQCKDIQTDVLAIEGWLKTSSLQRNAGKNSCPKVRKHPRLSPSTAKKPVSSISRQPIIGSKHDLLQCWGKIKKRQGGLRCPASKFLVIS